MEGNTEKVKSVKNKKEKFTLSESQLGYIMIAPALIIILAIAFYPVLRSFWYSLFDLRLNHPTKNATHLSYEIDMERYFNNFDLVKGALRRAAEASKGDSKNELTDAYNKLLSVNDSILKEKDVALKVNQVRALTDNFKPVMDDKIKYASISKTTAKRTLEAFNGLLSKLPAVEVEKDAQTDLNKAAGIMQELRDSIVSPNFIGLSNYNYYMHYKDFWDSVRYTFAFTIISVALELIFGILIALLINREFAGRGIVRASVLIPWAIPTVVSAMMWRMMYDGQTGIISHIFAKLHLIANSGILLTTHAGATFSIVFADVWKTTPYMALLLLAGLQGIDTTLYEASDVDGATKIQQFFKVTIPLLKPTILVALLFRTLDAFRVFDLVYVLTGGGNSTETISTLAYKTMFAQMEFGKGSTLSVVVFICISLISVGYIKILGADVMADQR